MNLELGSIITLSDEREFIIFSKLKEKEDVYVFLMSNFKPLEICFAKVVNQSNDEATLEIINEQEEKLRLMELFKKEYNL